MEQEQLSQSDGMGMGCSDSKHSVALAGTCSSCWLCDQGRKGSEVQMRNMS